jgi:hypothetical protein
MSPKTLFFGVFQFLSYCRQITEYEALVFFRLFRAFQQFPVKSGFGVEQGC